MPQAPRAATALGVGPCIGDVDAVPAEVAGRTARREAGRSPRGKTKWRSVPRAVARVEVRAAGALTRLSAFTSKTYDVCGFKTFRALFRATWSCGDIFY